jgi:hypothetical protein
MTSAWSHFDKRLSENAIQQNHLDAPGALKEFAVLILKLGLQDMYSGTCAVLIHVQEAAETRMFQDKKEGVIQEVNLTITNDREVNLEKASLAIANNQRAVQEVDPEKASTLKY